jgi:hypothetical protein
MALTKEFRLARSDAAVVIIALLLDVYERSFYLSHFVGAFLRCLRKAAVSSVVYCRVCLSVRMQLLDSHCKDWY